MSQRDRDILRGADISMSEAANLLKVSRPHLYYLTEEKKDDYLTQDRVNRIYAKLLTSSTDKSRKKADLFFDSAKKHGLIPTATDYVPGDCYIVFSDAPFEIRDRSFFDYMASYVYPKSKLVAYFFSNESVASRFVIRLRAYLDAAKAERCATIYVITTPIAEYLPHVAFVRHGNVWRGEVNALKDGQSAELTDEYVTNFLALLEETKFLLGEDRSPNEFFPGSAGASTATKDGAFVFRLVEKLEP